MDILFKNVYIRNKQTAKEIYSYYFFKRPLLAVCYIVMLIAFVPNLIGVILGDMTGVFGVVITVFVFAIQIYRYFACVNLMTKRDTESLGENPTIEMTVTDEKIETCSSKGAITALDFKSIKYAVQTKNYIIIFTKANLVHIFEKNSFTLGTSEGFLLFLTAKGIKVNGK